MPVKKNKDISSRLSLGFGIIVFLAIILGLATIFSINKLSVANSAMYKHPFTVSKAIGDINAGIFAIHRSLKDVVFAQTDEEIDLDLALINAYEEDIYKAFDIVEERFLGEKSDVAAARKAFDDWKPIRQAVIEFSRSGNKQAAAEMTRGAVAVHIDDMRYAIGQMREFANNKALSFYNRSQHILKITLISICVIVFATILAGVIIAIRTTKSIVKPLAFVVEGIGKINGGRLDHKIGLNLNDEIGILAQAFDDMVDRLKVTTASRDELNAANKELEGEIFSHKRTLEQLEKEEEHLRITLESIGDAVIATDSNGVVIMSNPVSQRLTGYTEYEACGKPLEEVFNIINYDTRLKVANPVAKVLETGRIIGLANHTVLISKDGKEYQIADSAAPLRNSDGETLGVVLVFRDVTAEYENSRELFERTERQRLAADAGGMGMWDWDIEKGTIIIDDNWKAIVNWHGSGYQITVEEFTANIHPDDRKLFKLSIEECLNGDCNFYDESYRFSIGDDRWVWLRNVGRVMGWNTKGNPVRIMGVTQNITERRNMEMNLAREKENLRITLNSIGDGVIATDYDGRITRINLVAQQLTGWNQWEAQGRGLQEVFNVIDEKTRQPAGNMVSKVIENSKYTGVENHKLLVNRLGGEYHISSSATPIKDKDGNIEGVVVVFRDVTKEHLQIKSLYEKTQYLQLAIDAARVGLWEWDILTGRFAVDDNWMKMFNVKGEKTFHVNATIGNVHPDDAEYVRKSIEDCLCGKTADYDVTFRYKVGSDKCVWVKSLGKVVERDLKGRPIKFMGVNVDITELKQNQIDLLYEKENIRITLNSIGDGVIATDTNGCVTRLNPVSQKLTGWTQEQANGLPLEEVFNIINAISRQKADNPVQRVLETGMVVGLANHTALISRDGKEYQIADSAAPIVDEQGKTSGVVLVFRDVTEEYKQRELLFEETERRRLAVDAAKIGIWDWNVKTDRLVVDQGWMKMLNWKGPSVITAAEIMTVVHPDDFDDVKKAMETCTSGVSSDFSCAFRFNLPMSVKWIMTLGRAVEFDENGSPTRILGVNQDITGFKDIEFKLRESEQRFRAMFDNSPLMIALLTTDLKPEFINKGYERLGYSLDELKYFDSSSITHPDDREVNGANFSKMLAGEIDNFIEEKRYVCKDGSSLDIELVAVAIKDENNELKYVLTMATDISHRNKILDDLRRSNHDLEQFAYVASHDLKEPLRTIGLYVELLEREYTQLFDKDASAYMEFIISGVKRMNALINGLLEYSRVDNSANELGEVDTSEVLDIVKANLKYSILQSGADIVCEDLAFVCGDKQQLVQLFQNIISNAIRFSYPDRKPVVIVSSQKKGSRRLFTISDNGIGIEKEYYEKIFNIFSRLHSRHNYEGSGIGLAVAKKIVEKHGGKIWLESECGKGTTFYFTLAAKS